MAAAEEVASFQTVKDAAQRIQGAATVTPVMTCSALNKMAGRSLFFKCENFQKVGAFKFRGAYNAVSKYVAAGGKGPIVTHSSGNHAQAVAKVAQMMDLVSYIVMPENSSQVKVDAVKEYGANVIPCGNAPKDRAEVAEQTAGKYPGCVLLPSYNHVDIISGQGTLMLEFLGQLEEPVDAIIVPVGGGGMLSGCCLAAKGLQPNIRIFAAEPLGADDCARSMKEGKMLDQTSPNTIADGLRTGLGTLTWPVIRDNVEEVITVTEEEIVSAMRLVYMRMKLVIEPSAAVGVAVALSDRFKALEGINKVGIVICGGNVDIDKFPWLRGSEAGASVRQ